MDLADFVNKELVGDVLASIFGERDFPVMETIRKDMSNRCDTSFVTASMSVFTRKENVRREP